MRRFDDWIHDNVDALVAGAFVVIMSIMALLMSGCSSYTVVAADRELVPVREVGDGRYVFDASEGCTGWYVPNAVMLEMAEALEGI